MRKKGSVIAKIMLVIFIVLTLGFGSYAGFRLFTGGKESDLPEKNVKRNYVVLADPAVIPSASEDEVNAASSYDVKMNSEWTFRNGKAYSEDAFVENPLSNLNSVYFDVKINGYSEPVYTSPVLPVGSHIENISLDKELKAGTYKAVLTYTLLSKDEKDSVGTLQMAVKIIVGGN